MKAEFYWPFIASDLVNHVKQCGKYIKAKSVRFTRQHKLRIFPLRDHLQDITINILRPLLKTDNDNTKVVIIKDRYSKLTTAIRIRKGTQGFVSAAFINNWILPNGIPDSIMIDNGAQFVAKPFKYICNVMGIKRPKTIAYYHQTNGRTEKCNQTIATRLRHYVSDH